MRMFGTVDGYHGQPRSQASTTNGTDLRIIEVSPAIGEVGVRLCFVPRSTPQTIRNLDSLHCSALQTPASRFQFQYSASRFGCSASLQGARDGATNELYER
eukprot:scaffold163961_cov44-Prasinocladus_malaysianus.AAC.1